MKKLLSLLSEEEMKVIELSGEIDGYGMLEHCLLKHMEELSFEEYYRLRKLKMMDDILNELRLKESE